VERARCHGGAEKGNSASRVTASGAAGGWCIRLASPNHDPVASPWLTLVPGAQVRQTPERLAEPAVAPRGPNHLLSGSRSAEGSLPPSRQRPAFCGSSGQQSDGIAEHPGQRSTARDSQSARPRTRPGKPPAGARPPSVRSCWAGGPQTRCSVAAWPCNAATSPGLAGEPWPGPLPGAGTAGWVRPGLLPAPVGRRDRRTIQSPAEHDASHETKPVRRSPPPEAVCWG
jgi:hypothetical protein